MTGRGTSTALATSPGGPHSEPVDTTNYSRPLGGSAEETRAVEIRVDFRKPDTRVS